MKTKITAVYKFDIYKSDKNKYLLNLKFIFNLYYFHTDYFPLKMSELPKSFISNFSNKFDLNLYLNKPILIQLYETLNNLHVTDKLKSHSIKIIDGRSKIQKINIPLNVILKEKINDKLYNVIYDEKYFDDDDDEDYFDDNVSEVIVGSLEMFKQLLK